MTLAPAALENGFKNCCLQASKYDGSKRNHYF